MDTPSHTGLYKYYTYYSKVMEVTGLAKADLVSSVKLSAGLHEVISKIYIHATVDLYIKGVASNPGFRNTQNDA